MLSLIVIIYEYKFKSARVRYTLYGDTDLWGQQFVLRPVWPIVCRTLDLTIGHTGRETNCCPQRSVSPYNI